MWRGADDDWQAAGRIIAAAGAQGVVQLDTARVNASAMGIDVGRSEASALRAATGTKGISQAKILSASSEQIAALKTQLKRGEITAAQFAERLDATTKRIAETGQILGTSRGDFTRGAEDARQLEKAIALTGPGLDPKKQQEFSNAFLNAAIASGGDVTGEEIKRMLQQYGAAFSAGLRAVGAARLALIRDEGGRQSTAEIRMMQQDLVRGNLNRADLAQQKQMGLRNSRGESTIDRALFSDPLELVNRVLRPLALAAKIDTSDVVKLQEFYDKQAGLTTNGARFAARATAAAEQYANELERFRNTDARKLLTPTIAAQTAEVNTAFKDSIGNMTKDWVSFITSSIGSVGNIFTSLANGQMPAGADVGRVGGLAALGVGRAAAGSLAGQAALGVLFNPLNSSATALTGSATALTRAAMALGGSGVAGGASAAATGAAVGGAGLLTKFFRVAGIAGVTLGGVELVRHIDPKGNLWGLSDSLDKYVQQKTGINPSNIAGPNVSGASGEAVMDEVRKLRAERDRLQGAISSGNYFERQGTQSQVNNIDQKLKAFENSQSQLKADMQTSFAGILADSKVGLSTAIGEGGVAAGQTIATGMTSGAQAAAGILSSAIATAVSNIRVSATVAAGSNTGATQLNR